MSFVNDLTQLVPKAVIAAGTYKGSTNPTNAVIDTFGSESGVLLICNCTALTDAQTLSVTLCNNADGTTGAVTLDALLATNPEAVVGSTTAAVFEALAGTGITKLQVRAQNYRYVTVTCTGAGGTGATFSILAIVGPQNSVNTF